MKSSGNSFELLQMNVKIFMASLHTVLFYVSSECQHLYALFTVQSYHSSTLTKIYTNINQ